MITLHFQIDEDELAADLAASPEAANPAAVEQTYFVMPVRFAVGETDFLAFRNNGRVYVGGTPYENDGRQFYARVGVRF